MSERPHENLEKAHIKAEKQAGRLLKIAQKLSRVELREFTNYLHSPWRIVWSNFLAGTARGLGFLVGAAIVLAVIGYLLKNILSKVPIVGDFFQAVEIWIEQALQNTSNFS